MAGDDARRPRANHEGRGLVGPGQAGLSMACATGQEGGPSGGIRRLWHAATTVCSA